MVQVLVNASADNKNSIFANVDAEPTDPAMIWDIPITSGFETRMVSLRGIGTFDNPQFVPAVFNLAAGVHQLILRGREADVQIDRISIVPYSTVSPPQNLHVISGF